MVQNIDSTNHNYIVKIRTFFRKSNHCPKKVIPSGKQSLQTVGIFNKYPVGVFNPAFTGMCLWELSSSHELNDYQKCWYHSIKSGIIFYGTEAYVFTQITNNSITSHLKILIRGKQFRNVMILAQAMKLLLNYVRTKSSQRIIPSMKEIQMNLHSLLGISEETYIKDTNTYKNTEWQNTHKDHLCIVKKTLLE